MIRYLLFIFLTLFASISFSQELTQTIRGRVVDFHSQIPLIGATIVVLESDPLQGTVTDVDGYFRLENIPVGRVSLQASFMGYNSSALSNLEVSSAKELVLNIALEEKVILGKEVEIVASKNKEEAQNEMALASARTFSIEETKRYAGTLNDVARMAQNYAGVQGVSDSRNDIVVRGNSPISVLYRLEGIDVPNPNHFGAQGTTGGPISILNNNTLSNSDFLTGAFPAEYGNTVAGVFDLKMRNGNDEQLEFVGQVGFNGLELLAEGPFKKNKRASYMVSYRYSTLELFKKLGIKFGTLSVPEYQDLSLKLNFPHKKGTTSIFGIGGISYIELLDSDIDTSNNIFGQTGEDIIYGSRVGVIGLSHSYILNKKTFLKGTVSLNAGGTTIINDSLSSIDRTPIPLYRNNSYNGKMTARINMNNKLSTQHQLRSGIIFDQLFFKLSDSTYIANLDRFMTLSESNGQTQFIRPYLQWQYRVTNDFTFNTGLYYQYFVHNGSQSLEPRAGLKWRINGNNAISFAYGLHSQMQPLQVYFRRELVKEGSDIIPNSNLEFTKSQHLVLGYDRSISENMRLKLETYYQKITEAPIDTFVNSYSMLNQGAEFGIGFPNKLTNNGTGDNYGIELTLEHFLQNGFYFLITGALYESKYAGSDNKQRSTAFNSNYNLTALAGKEFQLKSSAKRQHLITIDLKYTWIGGRPYIPIDLNASQLAEKTIYDDDKAYTVNYPDYLRFDVKMGYKINGRKISQEWGVYLQNTTNRGNIFSQEYDKETGEIVTTNQIGFLPVIQYRVEF